FSGGIETASSCLREWMSGPTVSTAWPRTAPNRTRSLRRWIFPLLIRDTSRRSSTNRVSCRACRSIMLAACCCVGPADPSWRMTWDGFRVGGSGLRWSVGERGRDSVLGVFAPDHSRLVSLPAGEAPQDLAEARQFPGPAQEGVTTPLAQNSEPSLRTCHR